MLDFYLILLILRLSQSETIIFTFHYPTISIQSAKFKEQLNTNPRIIKGFIDFMRTNKNKLSVEVERFLDFISDNNNNIK